jgi:peroxidase
MFKPTERTRLLSGETKPQYVFDTSVVKERQRRVKQFQCCLCVIFAFALLIGFLATIAYTINRSHDEISNSTNPTNETSEIQLIFIDKSWPLPDAPVDTKICNNETDWNEAVAQGKRALRLKNEIEKKIKPLPIDSPSYRHQKVVATSPKALILAELGYVEEFGRRYFPQNASKICKENNTNTVEYCTHTIRSCSFYQKFRSYNGSCNNLQHPQEFGVAYRPFRRSLAPDYADGISKPRVGQEGRPLPSARTVSLEVHRPYYKDDAKFSVLLAVWGQFVDHDMTATALNHGINGTSISCCLDNQTVHPECFPVELDPFDPYIRYNVTCMEFVRSAPAPTCCLGHREQMNQATSFIDGSVIYSVEPEVVATLRKMKNGELSMYVTEDNRTLLPVSKDLNDGCNREKENEKGRYCFLTGDARANENLHLTSMHLIWARHHNFVATKLKALNNDWDDERLFQETRKIIGAQMQHITYNEFLPVLLGRNLMEQFDLCPRDSGYFMKYNDSIDPSIANNFATAAFRFAHSIIPGLMKFLAKDSSSPEFIQLHKMLFDPFKLYQPGELDRALRGAMDTTIQANDPYFTDELKQHLFQDNSDKKMNLCGLDLVSLNIQRGRDHGLVGYNSWREHCGLKRVSTFKQLQGDIDDDSLQNIQSVYRNVEDIDLYTGALSEKPINGSILGPTLTCLILDQFIRVKYGDRFWYENPNSFSMQQLAEIRKSSLARIICDNSDNIESVQPLVMEKIRDDNQLVPCKTLQEPKWSPWKESLPHIRLSDDTISVKTSGNR